MVQKELAAITSCAVLFKRTGNIRINNTTVLPWKATLYILNQNAILKNITTINNGMRGSKCAANAYYRSNGQKCNSNFFHKTIFYLNYAYSIIQVFSLPCFTRKKILSNNIFRFTIPFNYVYPNDANNNKEQIEY